MLFASILVVGTRTVLWLFHGTLADLGFPFLVGFPSLMPSSSRT